MQICISINEDNHPALSAHITEIKRRGGSVSGEISTMLEQKLSGEDKELDELKQVVDKLTKLMNNLEAGVTFVNEAVVHENTQDMLGAMNFGFADDE